MSARAIPAALAVLNSKVFGKRKPLALNWAITNRCNYRCKYCDIPNNHVEELDTGQVLDIIDELAENGNQRIHFFGGEPLLRDDIGTIVGRCRERGISAGMISNGSLVPKRIKELAGLNLLKLSLDGPEEINDAIRQKGSYRDVMKAVEAAKNNDIRVEFNTTLSKHNLDQVDFILKRSEELDVPVKFSPVNYVHAGEKDVSEMLCPREEYREAIKMLMKEKKNNGRIVNSLTGLRYLYHWPDTCKISCCAGRLFCHVKPNGDVYPCERMVDKNMGFNCASAGFMRAFNSLPAVSCDKCWCTGTLELNLAYSLKPEAVINAARKLI